MLERAVQVEFDAFVDSARRTTVDVSGSVFGATLDRLAEHMKATDAPRVSDRAATKLIALLTKNRVDDSSLFQDASDLEDAFDDVHDR